MIANDIGGFHTDAATPERKSLMQMKNLTSEEQQRLWKLDEPPTRRILLWGLDGRNNPCLLILYGIQEFERDLFASRRSYRAYGHLLKPEVCYTHYAVFHGTGGHLPSIPNTYFFREKNLLCYAKGYKTAHRYWDYDRNSRTWQPRVDIDKKYIIPEFYALDQGVTFPYYGGLQYTDYAASLTSAHIRFQDCGLIGRPSSLFGFAPDSPYLETIVSMCSQERLYMRKKYLRQFMDMQPSAGEYSLLLKTASVELACGIFLELTADRNPLLLETAEQISHSDELWASPAGHEGLRRCIRQYVSLFDEKLLWKQKESIYRTLPEMDFHIQKLKLNGKDLEGEELEAYLNKPNAYRNLYYVFGSQELYTKNAYTDGTNIQRIAYKNTIQTATAYGMADALGRIAYFLDTPRTAYYFRGSGQEGAYSYFVRHLRRTFDRYLAEDEAKFITAAREMLTSYTDHDNLDGSYDDTLQNYFFDRYFWEVMGNDAAAEQSLWLRYLGDLLFVAQHAQAGTVHKFCYILLQKAAARHAFDAYEAKELAALCKIPYAQTAQLFTSLLLPRLEVLQEFDAELMTALMGVPVESLWEAARQYFHRTHGKFQPQEVAGFLFLDTLDTWQGVLEGNLRAFTAAEYIAFLKTVAGQGSLFLEQQITLSEQVTYLLEMSVSKLAEATALEQQETLRYFISLLLGLQKLPEFLLDLTEHVLFSMPYELLRNTLQDMELRHSRISEREYQSISLLKSCKDEILPKDSLILSILETGSKRLVKTLTELTDRLQAQLANRPNTLLLLFECNVTHLNQIAQAVFESLPSAAAPDALAAISASTEAGQREKLHMMLLDSPMEQTYQYALKKLDSWYGNRLPALFIRRMMEHPCVEVKAYLSQKMQSALGSFEETSPDLYLYYAKTLLYLPNRVTKSKEQIYGSMPLFLQHYPEKRQELEHLLLDIGSADSKIDSERALVAFARIQKEVGTL